MLAALKRIIFISCVGAPICLRAATTVEIELFVEDSIVEYFAENQQEVELKTLTYIGTPLLVGSTLKISTSVRAQTGLLESGWGWYDCETSLQILEVEPIVDLGSSCILEIE